MGIERVCKSFSYIFRLRELQDDIDDLISSLDSFKNYSPKEQQELIKEAEFYLDGRVSE